MALFYKYFYKFKWSLGSSLSVLCFFNIARGYLLPDLMRSMFDMDLAKVLYLLIGLHLSICASSCLSLYLGNVVFKCRLRRQIYCDIFDELLSKDYAYYNKPSADLVKRITDIATKLPEVLINIFIDILSILIGALGVSIGLLKDGVFFSLSVLSVFILFTGIAIGFMRITSSSYLNYSNAYAKLNGQLGSWITNILAVKFFSSKKLEKSRFYKEFNEVYGFDKAKEWNEVLFTICLNCAYFGILVVQIMFMINLAHKNMLRVQDIFIILTIYFKIYDDLFWYIIFLAKAFEGYFYCSQAINIVYAGKIDIGVAKLELSGHVKAVDVSVQHGHRTILNNLNFEILPGQKVVIMGRSGVGKSTIINLMTKLVEPVEGRIEFDGHNIQNISHEALMNNISVVTQDYILLDESEWVVAEEVNDFVAQIGVQSGLLVQKLSAGEKQRLALCRALSRKPKILLMDEPTSGLDIFNTRAIGELISKLPITIVATSHSKEFIQYFDRILVLRDGKIFESSNQ